MGEKVLIIDDDNKLCKLLEEYFIGNGYDVRALPDGLNIKKHLKEFGPDIIILDVMLPEKDGFEVLLDIRKQSNVPVIMLTAKGEETDRIVGLEMGADDYLPKPFNPRELLARIKAIRRRISFETDGDNSKGPDINKRHQITRGDIILNTATQTVKVGGKESELSSTEFSILRVMMERPNMVLSRDQLMNLARGKDFMAFDRSIDVHISKLRAKVETDPGSPKRIKTVWGTGYMFVDTL